MVQRKRKRGPIKCLQEPHHRIGLFGVKFAAEKKGAERRNQGHGDYRRGGHSERLGKSQRLIQLPFLTSQSKHRNESENDYCHREQNGPPNQRRSLQYGLPHTMSVFWINIFLLKKAKGIFCNDDSR